MNTQTNVSEKTHAIWVKKTCDVIDWFHTVPGLVQNLGFQRLKKISSSLFKQIKLTHDDQRMQDFKFVQNLRYKNFSNIYCIQKLQFQ